MPERAPTEVQKARAEPPSAPAPEAKRKVTASKSLDQSQLDRLAGLSKDQTAVGGAAGPASAKKSLPPENLKQFEQFDSRARTAKPSADKETGSREEGLRDATLAQNRAQNQPADTKAGVAGAMSEAVEVQAPAANAQMQNQNQLNQVNAQNVGGPTPPSQAKGAAKKAKSESSTSAYLSVPAPPPSAPAPATAFSDTGASRDMIAGALNPQLIVSPNKKALWRAGYAGMIEFSSDGGASWSRQSSNVLVDLTAGAAPSDKVCWIVGRAGTILLTTDAGSHWAILHSPLNEDLGGVRSTDALHATVWNSFNAKIFETTDGGITWKPAASQ